MNSKPETQKAQLATRGLERGTWNANLRSAFTLIELLVVIAVIAILAGLLFTAMPAVNGARARSVARAELTQISTAVEAYKGAYGSFPQDNKTNVALNPLYFELMGMVIRNASYVSLDGSYSLATNTVMGVFNITGLVNSSTSAQATDDRPAIVSFLKGLKPQQIGTNSGARILIFSADGTPWNYNSSNPTNNPGSYDLWIDLVAGGRTNRIANWNR